MRTAFCLALVWLSVAVWGAEWVYTGDALPSSSGWEIYGSSSYENGGSITSSISAGVWSLADNSTSNRCMVRNMTLGDVSFNTGVTLAARARCMTSTSSSYNLGITNGNIGAMYVSITVGQVALKALDGTTRGSYNLSGTVYHRYYLTVKNATQGDNNTATWRVYVDGTEVITWVGLGTHDGYDGFFAGHVGTTGRGTWDFDWIAGRNDGVFGPAQWDPMPSGVPSAPNLVLPLSGCSVGLAKPTVQWIGDPHTTYEVHVNTTDLAGDANVWDSGQVTSSLDSCDAGPLPAGSCYVFVRLRNSAGWGPWSAARSFSVDTSVPAVKKGWVLIRDDLPYHMDLLTHASEYHVNHVQLSHDIMMYTWEPINDIGRRNHINQLIDAAHANGVQEVVLWTHEIQYPDMPVWFKVNGKANLDDPGYWVWLDSEYEQLFTVCPNADGLVLTVTENWDGADPFDRTSTIHTGKSPTDSIAQVVQTIWNVCSRHGKSLYVRTWTGSAGPDRWIRDAVMRSDPSIWMMSKATGAGDWSSIQEDYDIIGTCTGHPEMEEFDVVGEYWGLTNTPWCGVDYQKHLWSEFGGPRGVTGVVARVDRDEGRAIDSPNRINMYALDVLADYPEMPVDDIYGYWCSHWFGQTAAGRVASALKRAFDVTNACYDLPLVYPFSGDVARDYCLRSLFDLDCASVALKTSSTFMPGSAKTNYDCLREPFERAAMKLSLTVPSTLFGDFSPSYSNQSTVTCSVTAVDAAAGLNPATFKVEYSKDGGQTWTNHANFSYTSEGSPVEPYHITAESIPFGSSQAARNRVRYSVTNLASGTTNRVFTVRGLNTASATLASSVTSDGILHPQGDDGDTVATTADGRPCRTPATSSDTQFYFQVDDAFAYDRSPQRLYLQVDYYGSNGSITPIYDSVERTDETLKPVYLSGPSGWRTATWCLDNVGFGNRISSTMKSDFRLDVGSGTGACISAVRLYYDRPSSMLEAPVDLTASMVSSSQISMAWAAVPGATMYQVCGEGTFAGWATSTTFQDTGLAANTQYTYAVIACDASGFSSCASLPVSATTLSVPPTTSNVVCDRPAATWQRAFTFDFTPVNGFGAGKVAYYRYVWDESPTHVWTGNEPVWPSIGPPQGTGWSIWYPTTLPTQSDSGWLLYEGSTSQRLMSEELISGGGVTAWKLSDQGRVWNTKAKIGLWPTLPINRDIGATMVVRMRAGDSPLGFYDASLNFGFNLFDCSAAGAIVRPGTVQLIGPSRSSSTAVVENGLAYHTYVLTLRNEIPGDNSTCRYDLYCDGNSLLGLTQGPSGGANMWSGPVFGNTSSNVIGAWCYEWIAWRNDGVFTPSPSPVRLSTSVAHYGSSFYLHLYGFNADSTPSGSLDLGPYYCWNGLPVAPSVFDDGTYTTRDTVHATWSPAGPSITRYECAVGSSPGAQDVLPYVSVGQALEATLSGLSMAEGHTYYISVRGLGSSYGPAGTSDGIIVAPAYDEIAEAKALPDGSPVAFYGKDVTAVFADCAYVQDVSGVRIVTGRPTVEGGCADLAGVIGTAGTERVIATDTVVPRQ